MESTQGEYGSGQIGQSFQALGNAAAEFSSNVREATDRLAAAAQQFAAVSEGLEAAVREAQAAAERAEAARHAAEEVQARMERNYGNVADLVRDLQERIGALAILTRPLPSEVLTTPPPETGGEAPQEAPPSPQWPGV